VLLAVAAVIIIPVVYAALGGFRDAPQLAANPVGLPNPWVWTNYTDTLTSASFWLQLRNSAVVAGLSTVIVVLFAALAAFVLAGASSRAVSSPTRCSPLACSSR
jgi:raffinose/stachyose/melibiose transport system permease protein